MNVWFECSRITVREHFDWLHFFFYSCCAGAMHCEIARVMTYVSAAPSGADIFLGAMIRWFRCASPPANFFQAFGLRGRYFLRAIVGRCDDGMIFRISLKDPFHSVFSRQNTIATEKEMDSFQKLPPKTHRHAGRNH